MLIGFSDQDSQSNDVLKVTHCDGLELSGKVQKVTTEADAQ